ncbi:DUF2178 domain-containing protein [Catenulispora sp. NF23]|uniref:DUF2178 domain-containing protein n=1 Tax=Catenulispora pinistramenti TaxID=2705254 RepID=A0ABS5KSA3_9ACTN|nr:DUF2178 domain-containing protein [Catenulispora pinistramenti]MBS2533369.1 DUF2178 domain-containing protein [Catenulispora pinistramenti]MBS2548894.1 DUF2178 domain-containing protein [Catenulispora pinistramenti]
MSTDADAEAEGTARGRGGRRGSWIVPVTAIVMGGVFLAIYLGHHDIGMAVAGLVVMLGYAVVLVFGSRRSEALSLLRGQSSDERGRSIEQRASSVTLHVLVMVLVGGFIVSTVRGHGQDTWANLCAVAGGVYILSTIVLTRRG